MGIELRQLRAFITVVDEGTFTDAAIVPGHGQPGRGVLRPSLLGHAPPPVRFGRSAGTMDRGR